MRSLTKDHALDAKVMTFLIGKGPQTVCAVSIGVNEKPEDVRASLHRLTESQDVFKHVRAGRSERFERAHGGYDPDGGRAA